MTITPLAPRTPYIAVSAGSFSTWIDAMSCGLMPLSAPPAAASTGTPSITYSGSLLPCNDVTPRMRTEMPPSDVRDTITPGKRSISNCSIGRPGALAISSEVTVEFGPDVEGGAGEGGGASEADVFRWAQAELSPMRMLTGNSARIENEVIGLLPWHAGTQYTLWRASRLIPHR